MIGTLSGRDLDANNGSNKAFENAIPFYSILHMTVWEVVSLQFCFNTIWNNNLWLQTRKKSNSNDEIQCDRQYTMTRVNEKHQHWNRIRWGQNRTVNSTRFRDEFQCIHTKQRKPTTSNTRQQMCGGKWERGRAQIKLAQRIYLMIKITNTIVFVFVFCLGSKKNQHFTKSEYRSLICSQLCTHVLFWVSAVQSDDSKCGFWHVC